MADQDDRLQTGADASFAMNCSCRVSFSKLGDFVARETILSKAPTKVYNYYSDISLAVNYSTLGLRPWPL